MGVLSPPALACPPLRFHEALAWEVLTCPRYCPPPAVTTSYPAGHTSPAFSQHWCCIAAPQVIECAARPLGPVVCLEVAHPDRTAAAARVARMKIRMV